MCSFIALRGRWAWGLWQVQDVAVTLRESSMLWGIVAGLMGAGLAARTAPSDMVVGGCSGAVHSWHPLALVLAADDCPPHRDGHRGGPAGR